MNTTTLDIRRTFKYRLYRCDKLDKALHQQINVAAKIWNHSLALQRRYYRLFGKHISEGRLKSHIAKLRRQVARFAYWQALGSQAVQHVVERLDAAFQRFFAKQGKLPRFKKVKKYKSFTLKQTAGWKLLCYNLNEQQPNGKYKRSRGVVEIANLPYKFVQHRPLLGQVKTVTLKRDSLGGLWVCFSVVERVEIPKLADLSKMGGFDFGLRTFLTDETGKRWTSPLFFAEVLKQVQQRNRSLSRKVEGSHHYDQARRLLARAHKRVSDKRRDFDFRLAHGLCDTYDVLGFEDLHLTAMKKLWGRKVSDLGFSKFLAILNHVAMLRGKVVVQIDRFEPTTQRCSGCGHKQAMPLRERQFVCQQCGITLDRDHNAAINIQHAGASAHRAEELLVLHQQAAPLEASCRRV
jgi:putative transposase